jgi:uncharacterized membrane protein YbaN (DUF454 family)
MGVPVYADRRRQIRDVLYTAVMEDQPQQHPTTDQPAPVSSLLAPPRTRWLWLLLAYVSLGVGLVAIVIPGIPTTEFILLAAWAATKSSPRLAAWLERHRLFGPMIYNWRHGRVVARRAKLSATLAMSLCLLIMVWFVPQRWVVVAAAVGMAAGAAWMWSRPERVASPD